MISYGHCSHISLHHLFNHYPVMPDKKDRPFIKAHDMQALAWGVVLYVVSFILSFVVVGACIGLLGFSQYLLGHSGL